MKRLYLLLQAIKDRGSQLALAAAFAATSLAFAAPAGVAHAASRNEFCINGNTCLNAWNTGPAVDVYGPGVANDDFQLEQSSNPNYVNIEFLGNNLGLCIGDYNNDSGDATAGLDSGCGPHGNTPWGGNYSAIVCGSGPTAGLEFKNVHWNNSWLGPRTFSNGQSFYLNKPTPYCFESILY